MKSLIKTILIPTDFSESSENALNVGISIARRQKAEILILHVIDRFAYLQPAEVFIPDVKPMPDINYLVEHRLREFTESIAKKTGIEIKFKVLNGQPSEQICALAYEKKISLIVIGTHGSSGLRSLFIGSEAYRVVKNAPCPVLTIPGKWENQTFSKVLFPIRLIPGTLDKYFYSRPIIEKNNSELFLLGLTDMKDPGYTKELIEHIENLKKQLQNDKIKYQISYCPGEDFPEQVIKSTREFGIDLIILTANIDIDWKTFFIGPFVQQIINHSQVPVLSIKPANSERLQSPYSRLGVDWGSTIDAALNKKGSKK